VHNWSWQDVKVPAPTGGRDALDAAAGDFHHGDLLDLGPWGVRVLVESPAPARPVAPVQREMRSTAQAGERVAPHVVDRRPRTDRSVHRTQEQRP
jgi:hypothetical protein